jgi:hypothetical protein
MPPWNTADDIRTRQDALHAAANSDPGNFAKNRNTLNPNLRFPSFSGFRKVIERGVDAVILETSPYFFKSKIP